MPCRKVTTVNVLLLILQFYIVATCKTLVSNLVTMIFHKYYASIYYAFCTLLPIDCGYLCQQRWHKSSASSEHSVDSSF